MLSISPAASAALASLLATPHVPAGAVVRIASAVDRSGEPAIGITNVTDTEIGDEPIESAVGVPVFADPETADALDDQQLDGRPARATEGDEELPGFPPDDPSHG
jgi:hypothetical protein